MIVREIMTEGAECLDPTATIRSASEQMKRMNVGSLPVCDNDRLVGMLTDRDIVIRAIAEGRDPNDCQVRDVMTPELICCFEDQSTDDAAEIMRERQIRRLLVLNRDKRLVGVLSLGDLAVRGQDEHLCGTALEGVSEPAMPLR